MASRNSAIVSKFVKRSLSASTQPEQVKKSLKHFTEIPGLNVKDVLVGLFKADLRKGLCRSIGKGVRVSKNLLD